MQRAVSKRGIKVKLAWLGGISLATGAALMALFALCHWLMPFDFAAKGQVSTTVYTEQGQILRQFTNQAGVYRIATQVDQVSPFYTQALLAYEDRYFYQHVGVNPVSLVRALFQHAYYGRVISGGSTITMQVARMFYPHQRTYLGKISQIFRALQLEWMLDKGQILNLYLTHTPMGGNIEGVQAASLRYFGKMAKDLSHTESALLVVIPQRPSLHRPDRHPQLALNARNKVLDRLLNFGVITPYQHDVMANEALSAKRRPLPQLTPLLARELQKKQIDSSINQGRITTTINQTLQADVNAVVEQRLSRLSPLLSIGILVMENASGHVLAYKGSADFNDAQRAGHVDMTKAVRSPGSTLKPFIYGMALDLGLVHSASLLTDTPRAFGDYRPANFSQGFIGAMRLDQALQTSKNVPAVQVMAAITPAYFADKLKQQGISLRVAEPNLAIALGGNGSTLRELVTLYSALARQGKVAPPVFTMANEQGLTDDNTHRAAPILSPAAAWIIADTLAKIPPPDRAKPAWGRKISWKTGTSYGYRDAWAVGVSHDYTVGIWIGRPDGAPFVGQTGANQAGPLLFDTFDLLPADKGRLTKPSDVVAKDICWPSGLSRNLVAEKDCLTRQRAWTIKGLTPVTLAEPGRKRSLHQWPLSVETLTKPMHASSQKRVKISFPTNNLTIFSYPKQKLKLVSNQAQANWYVNDQFITGQQLELAPLKSGKHRITACVELACDAVDILVY
ncbi:penicillin-binding protein 1C [Motilimonas eburnea]|uniref:penicillin-binding protein 1C n=1 Tax=Motilimonas eburnea TaxID=1737488 RepID=UPI001E2B7454|nr:penicillin-binding protein 1C [Motilimonas eburnea]MCE2571962.1 penicillin-binding protein 1C [Motilimonas eburnea]